MAIDPRLIRPHAVSPTRRVASDRGCAVVWLDYIATRYMLVALMVRSGNSLADFTVNQRVFLISALALVVGLFASLIAVALIWLINLVTNVAFFGRFSAEAASPTNSHLGVGLILVPVIGSLIIGLMARYGSEKIRGHFSSPGQLPVWRPYSGLRLLPLCSHWSFCSLNGNRGV